MKLSVRTWIYGVLLMGALAAVLFAPKKAANLSTPVVEAQTRAPLMKNSAENEPSPSLLALLPREDLLGRTTEDTAGKNPFSRQSWTPIEKPAPVKPVPLPPPTPLPAPTAPALPFVFLGKKLEAERWEVYLSRGDQTLIVREKDVIDNTYRIDRIAPPTLMLTYLPLNQSQQLAVGNPQ